MSLMKLVIEMEFPWSEAGTEEDERNFAILCLNLITNSPLGDMSPKGGVITNVRAVRGSMAVARAVLSASLSDDSLKSIAAKWEAGNVADPDPDDEEDA